MLNKGEGGNKQRDKEIIKRITLRGEDMEDRKEGRIPI